MSESLASVRGATVRFGGTVALDRLDLDFESGTIHALVGENGAGKSTLVRVLAGAIEPSDGVVTAPSGDAIAWAPQETFLPSELSVADWIFLGRELRSRVRLLRRNEMERQARDALAAVHSAVRPDTMLGALSPAERKQVQLARALFGAPSLLLVDEPTAVLGAAEAEALFDVLRAVRDRGACVVYVSHHLPEVLGLADWVSVLRDGCLVTTTPARTTSEASLVGHMVGRELTSHQWHRNVKDEIVLSCRNLSVAHLRAIDLDVRAGEVVGVAGLVGAGRTELLDAFVGLRTARQGTFQVVDPPVLLPEDRANKGLIGTFSVRGNLLTPAPTGWLQRRREDAMTREWIDRLRIRARGPEDGIAALSGGNQQKVLLARALRQAGRLLLLDEPTAGVDIGAKSEIHDIIRDFAAQGGGVLMASSDLPELLAVCDRIVALRGGRVIRTFDRDEFSEQSVADAIVRGDATVAEVAA